MTQQLMAMTLVTRINIGVCLPQITDFPVKSVSGHNYKQALTQM